MELIISLIAGALGGNAVGAVAKNLNLGVLLNSVAGIVGGGLGSQIIGNIAHKRVRITAGQRGWHTAHQHCCRAEALKRQAKGGQVGTARFEPVAGGLVEFNDLRE